MPCDTFVENAWYVAGRSQEFPVDDLQARKIANRPVLVWRTRARLTPFAVAALAVHGTNGSPTARCARPAEKIVIFFMALLGPTLFG